LLDRISELIFKNTFSVGALFALISVAMGAFGSHALKDKFSESRLATYNIANNYLMFHALALCLLGICLKTNMFNFKYMNFASLSLISGIIIFSGSLYLLSFTQLKWYGAITPIGGLLLLLGWLLAFIASVNWS
jgi:uncharacterized membrane protein YgdD (TMEM256/DUF423 family)